MQNIQPVYQRQFTPFNFEFYMNALTNLPVYPYGDRNMISVYDPNSNYQYGHELFQIIQITNDEYLYLHLEKDTHRFLDREVINPYTFNLYLPDNYVIELYYGPTLIDPTLSYFCDVDPILLRP
jgi:hypothetical protein